MTLSNVIAAYQAANQAYMEAAKSSHNIDDDEQVEALFSAKEDAENAVIRFPCASLEDVQVKARLALHDPDVFDSCTNCHVGGVHVFTILMTSILGEFQA